MYSTRLPPIYKVKIKATYFTKKITYTQIHPDDGRIYSVSS